MFDDEFRGADDAEVVSAIGAAAVAQTVAAARRLAAIGELAARWMACDDDSRWVCDGWDCGAAEVAAVLGIGHGWASAQMQVAMALRVRLPQVAALFMAGGVAERVVEAIVWRTALVADAEVMAALDGVIANVAGGWQGLSRYKLEQAIDALVDRHDPAAVRRTRSAARGREVIIGGRNHQSGTAALWGRLFATDAALLERRLDQMARGVCEQDPRTIAQRRADALGSLAAGSQVLTCQCAAPDCPAAGPDARATSVVIHVLADPDALAGHSDPHMSGDGDDADGEGCGNEDGDDGDGNGGGSGLSGRPDGPSGNLGDGGDGGGSPGGAVSAPDAGSDLPIPRLRQTRRTHRPRPPNALAVRGHPPLGPAMLMPSSSPAPDLLDRLDRHPTPRRHHRVDEPIGAHLHHSPRQPPGLPRLEHRHRTHHHGHTATGQPRPRTDDAHPETNPPSRTSLPHHQGTKPQRTPHGRPEPTTTVLAGSVEIVGSAASSNRRASAGDRNR